MGKLKIPKKYFSDFLRGCFDGDGCFYFYWDPRWKSSHMFYLEFVSASKKRINWLRDVLKNKIKVIGHITKDGRGFTYQLKYAKSEAWKIIKRMYHSGNVICLSRKRKKIERALRIEQEQQKSYVVKE